VTDGTPPTIYDSYRSRVYDSCPRVCRVTPKRHEPPPRRGFGELEQEVLGVLWAADGPLVARDVLQRLDDPPAYTTVTTILDRLVTKGTLRRTPRGRAFAYEALQSETDASAERARALLKHGHDRSAVLRGFVDVLSDDDADELQRLLRQAQRRRDTTRGA
jgi:predicted transcriptional regulator